MINHNDSEKSVAVHSDADGGQCVLALLMCRVPWLSSDCVSAALVTSVCSFSVLFIITTSAVKSVTDHLRAQEDNCRRNQ